MVNKRLKIENLNNLQELTTEGVSSIQGGLTLADSWHKEPPSFEERLLPPWHRPTKPFYPSKPDPYPLPYYPCSPHPDSKLPWCAVIL